jgi:hypothetical protein
LDHKVPKELKVQMASEVFKASHLILLVPPVPEVTRVIVDFEVNWVPPVLQVPLVLQVPGDSKDLLVLLEPGF